MTKRRLTAIKFDKERLITKFGYLDHNSQKVTHERIIMLKSKASFLKD